MFTKYFRLMVFPAIFCCIVVRAIITEPKTNDEFHFNGFNESTDEVGAKSFSWLKSAKDMFATPTGHVVTRVARELLNRSTGNSQVRSDVVLIFAAAFLGAGHLGYGGYGYGYNYPRSAARSENGLGFGLSDGEDAIITAFLAAQGSGIDDCLYAAACTNPNISLQYTKAAKALMEGIQKFDSNPLSSPRYNDLVNLMEKATYDGLRGRACNTTADCSNLI